MTTQVDFILNPLLTAISPATSPSVFSTSSDQALATIITAGAVADLVTAGILKVRDIIFVNYDVDGTPGQAVLTVTSTSGGSLIAYSIPAGYLLAANNLSDLVSPGTAANNIGAQKTSTIIAQESSAWGGGSASHAYTVPGITTSSILATPTIKASANAVSVVKAVPTANTITVTYSADPGAGTIMQFIAFANAQ